MTEPVPPPGPQWGPPPALGWLSDNPDAARAIWELSEGEPYHATVVDAEARVAFGRVVGSTRRRQ